VTFGITGELGPGEAIDVFTQPDRVVVGLRVEADRTRVEKLLRPFTDRIEWMSVESAEMTKHALNAFLATSIVFINEVASLCEAVGADAKEVERGLKSEARIGPQAYLAPGGAFAGGTLARDITFLTQLGTAHHMPTYLITAVHASNDAHKNWPRRKLQLLLGDLHGKQIAVWGLTYKPNTSTLRRSSSIELCMWLAAQGAQVQAHDPAVMILPAELAEQFVLCPTPIAALRNAEALLVATEWPEYQAYSSEAVVSTMHTPLVVDPNRFLIRILGNDPRIRYAAVGKTLT
jgi:UDPglucose 6-dehydrogenase